MIPRIIARSSGRARPVSRLAGAVIAVIALVGSLAIATPAAAAVAVEQNAQQASQIVDAGIVKAAPVVGFNAENIISDALFYDNAAMTAAEIQAFLDARIGTCNNGKCLNVLNAGISSRGEVRSQSTGNLICSAIQGGTMKVSELIYRVQVACGISAKVILVTLQKEQGLTTSKAPSDWNLSAAMGASCPDTAPCDPAFAGVGPQILKGTQQLMTYKAARFGKQPGVNYIGYSPNASCGGRNLNIQNYATAALYTYTPYQPNGAALAAGFGLGDACSAYGNRNFYNYYTQWFGSTQRDPSTEIEIEYQSQGGAATLGAAVTGVLVLTENGGGYARAYANGSVYWTMSTGAKTVWVGAIRDYYFAHGGADGSLGWPAARRESVDAAGMSGTAQLFTGGSVFASGRGAFVITDPVRSAYFAAGSVFGSAGWPVSELTCPRAGVCTQSFDGSVFVTSSAGTFGVSAPVLAAYSSAGAATGTWGVPVSSAAAIAGTTGAGQAFEAGSAYYRAGGSVFFVSGPIRDHYFSLGGAAGSLGYPLAAALCADASTCRQQFESGWILWQSGAGARVGEVAIEDAYARAGGAAGVLGARTSGLIHYAFSGGGSAQTYTGGAIYYTQRSGAHPVVGAIREAYNATGGAAGIYGWPVGDQTCGSGWCEQAFERATLVTVGNTLFAVTEAFHDAFHSAGGSGGTWGPPSSGLLRLPAGTGGLAQVFGAGSAYHPTGGAATFVTGRIRDAYFTMSGATGRLGFPLSPQLCTSALVCQQRFEYGWIVTDATSFRVTVPAIDDVYASSGGASGALGARGGAGFVAYPYGGGGFAEAFAQGSVFYKPSIGAAYAVSGTVRAAYFAANGAAGRYGWPTGTMTCTTSSCTQPFEGGAITTGR